LTHLTINNTLCGEAVTVEKDLSRVVLKTLPEMAVDQMGLVHGGFIFGLADYAAMIAVNDPNVVLGAADVKFLKPVKVGDEVEACARVVKKDGKKHAVSVIVKQQDQSVFEGNFTCFVLERHVLNRNS
jgi:uncharacterized protein (TIGR00369 family)